MYKIKDEITIFSKDVAIFSVQILAEEAHSLDYFDTNALDKATVISFF